ncbi:hypothetical protein KY360_02550 [Candidatus Woesearchaeota archaeon]|nr:hypothetical protein [Candidatus Woesearchaeota archaeon]
MGNIGGLVKCVKEAYGEIVSQIDEGPEDSGKTTKSQWYNDPLANLTFRLRSRVTHPEFGNPNAKTSGKRLDYGVGLILEMLQDTERIEEAIEWYGTWEKVDGEEKAYRLKGDDSVTLSIEKEKVREGVFWHRVDIKYQRPRKTQFKNDEYQRKVEMLYTHLGALLKDMVAYSGLKQKVAGLISSTNGNCLSFDSKGYSWNARGNRSSGRMQISLSPANLETNRAQVEGIKESVTSGTRDVLRWVQGTRGISYMVKADPNQAQYEAGNVLRKVTILADKLPEVDFARTQ